ncbi:UNKNOWN [Stylonychia lemnae]|uniref:Trafficking protein particle complex subunit 6b n=1 Tax=Stylonychia lemnae TaxID=5949 RepID=A0A078AWL6_STYLE|nr:UNKNOWN [Stylonychia lemnae]|eukprot:CDW86850.1 UNKNOWN [Stylonychia lemnae]
MISSSTQPVRQPQNEIFDSFYELFIYESIEQIIQKHKNKEASQISSNAPGQQSQQQASTVQQDIYHEIDMIARTLGRKIIDLLIRDIQYKFQTQLDTMKFICTEFWKFTFSKQVDNLRTNNTGTYIFTDEAFKFTGRVSNNDHESKEYKQKIKCYESFVVGLIIGALMNIGYDKVPIVNTQIAGTKLVLTVNVPLPNLS